MMFEGGAMDDDSQMSDWLSTTGKSDMRVNWRMAKECQKFWPWMPTGDRDLGDEELDGRERNEVWTNLRHRNAGQLELRNTDCSQAKLKSSGQTSRSNESRLSQE
jgi:hypothetical protein